MTADIVIGYHGHCFDGMASAALLTRVLRELGAAPASAKVHYVGLDHQPGGSYVPERVLRGDINAVVDFRYTTSDKLTWWFDHHVTGLVGAEEHAHFAADSSERKFYDPASGSCCRLIAEVARDRLGVALPQHAELVRWAHIIDTAGFKDAQEAVELAAPALQWMTVIDAHGDDAFLAPRIARLAEGTSVEELVAEPSIQALLAPLLDRHRATCALIEQRATERQAVVFFDLSAAGLLRYNPFIPYWLHPSARYSVSVTLNRSRAKVSVGSNPWSPVPRIHDIAALCARYGGGGHPVVGAVSFKPEEIERARCVAEEIAAQLSRG